VLEGLRLVWQRVAGTIMTDPWAEDGADEGSRDVAGLRHRQLLDG
jgi:hypothetical protein